MSLYPQQSTDLTFTLTSIVFSAVLPGRNEDSDVFLSGEIFWRAGTEPLSRLYVQFKNTQTI